MKVEVRGGGGLLLLNQNKRTMLGLLGYKRERATSARWLPHHAQCSSLVIVCSPQIPGVAFRQV